MFGWRTVTITGVLLALALALPGVAAAAPACDPAKVLDAVHIGASVHGDITCDDPSGTGLNYSIAAGHDPAHGFASPDGVGGLDYYADLDFVGTVTFRVQVDDNDGGTTSIDVSVNVTDARPVCQAVDLGTVPRNQPAYGDVSCTDPDGDFLDYVVTQPTHGSAATFGDLEYTPSTNFSGSDQFTYTATDGALTSTPANVTVNVQNNAPVCNDGDERLRTGKPITLYLDCFDLDGDPLTLSVVDAPAHGTLGAIDNAGQTVTYTPTGSYTGPDHFTYRASDGDKQSSTVTVTLTITPNHAPVCETSGARHTRVGTALSVFVFCFDDDAQDEPLTYSVVAGNGPSHGTLGTFSGSMIAYTPTAGYTGVDSFRVRASDGALSATGDVPLHVSNGPLCSTPAAATVRSGQSRQLFVDCTQPNDVFTDLQYEIVAAPTKGHLDSSDLSFDPTRVYTANAGASGADFFTIRAVSGTTMSPTVQQDITTGASANNPPQCDTSGSPETVYAGRPAPLFPNCFDLDEDSLTYTAGATPAHGTSSVANNDLTYLADSGYTGLDSVAFSVSDGHGGTVSAQQPVEVAAPEAPNCSQGPLTATVRPGASTTLELSCFSPQDDPQSYSVVGTPSKGTLGSFGEFGDVKYTANPGTSGQETFGLRASNAVGDSPVQGVTITIDAAYNRAPTCFDNTGDPEKVLTATATPLKLARVCEDPDGDPIVYVRKSQPTAGGTLTAGPAASLSYTSPVGFLGTDSFTFIARDDRGAESEVTTHELDVVSSLAPTCSPTAAVSLRPGQTRFIDLDCQDPGNNEITYKIVSGPASGTLSPAGDSTDSTRRYTAPATAGDGSFTYRATSAGGDSIAYTQTITVTPSANQAPTCFANASDPQVVAQARATVLDIAGWCDDGDGDVLTFTRITPNPAHGTATASAGKITYTSTAGYTGLDTIGYSASDGHGGTATGAFTVDVQPVTPPTCTAPDPIDVRPTRSVDVFFACTDPFDSPITYQIVTGPSAGTLDPAGSSTADVRAYTAGASAGDVTIVYRAHSENGDSTPVTQTIHVDPAANSAPECSSHSGSAEKVAAGHARTLSPDCFDFEDDPISYHKLSNPNHGTLTDTGGKLVYTPANGFTGQDSFNYNATDGHGGTSAPTAFFVEVIQAAVPSCDAPTAITLRPSASRDLEFSCTDALGDPLTYVIDGAPAKGTLTGSGADRTYHAGTTAGSDSFTWHAHSDSTGDSAIQTQPITIDAAANVVPQCPATVSTVGKPSVARTITPACTDGDGDALTFAKQTNPGHGTLTDTGGVLRYTAAAGYTGPDSFTYKASDGHGGQSAVSTVSITVSAANQAPTCDAGPSGLTVAAGASITVPALSCSDPDGDPVTIEIPTAPAKGTLGAVQSDGTRKYTANAGASGTDSFGFRAFDGTARSAIRTVTIAITGPATPPTVSLAVDHASAEQGSTLTFTATASDPDGGSITEYRYSVDGTVVQTGTGRTLARRFDATGSHTVTVRVTDDDAQTATASKTVTITAKPSPSPSPSPSPGPGPTPTPETPPAPSVIAGKQKLKTVIAKGVVAKASCDKACTFGIQLVLDKTTAKKLKLGKKAVVVGKLAGAAPGTLKIKLTGKAKKAFKKAKSVKLTLIAVASGAGGDAPPVKLTVTLKK